ncbi:MAG: 1-acyl-sn-glycerol-3-phosphate acyltransferase [Candidatus Kerfeldbacteria bacterium]|nr:1-acyl-sn-glycerol-3-phosphate acyltransferase [Candidatus Kerfeldbacteria bacterium]
MAFTFLRHTILPLALRRVQVEGLEHVPTDGPFIVVANHQSYLDAVLVAVPLAVHRDRKAWWLTTEHIWKTFRRIGGTGLLRWLGMLPINEAHKADSLRPALERLAGGGVVGIFPEGRRNKRNVNPEWGRVMLKGKTGAARLALTSGVPVVPVGLIAPAGGTAFEAIRNFLSPSKPAIVRFGSPLAFSKQDPTTFSRQLLDEITRQMMLAVAKLCGKEYPH